MDTQSRLGVEKALQKRPAFDRVDSVVERIERRLRRRGNKEIPSKFIGQMVLLELKKIDAVAYLRFVSVYRQFESVNDFAKELTTIAKI